MRSVPATAAAAATATAATPAALITADQSPVSRSNPPFGDEAVFRPRGAPGPTGRKAGRIDRSQAGDGVLRRCLAVSQIAGQVHGLTIRCIPNQCGQTVKIRGKTYTIFNSAIIVAKAN